MPYIPPVSVWKFHQSMPLRRRELFAALGLVALADLAIFRSGGGALGGWSSAVFFAGVPALLFAVSRARRLSPRLGAMAGLLAMIAARCAYAPTAGTVGVGVLLVFAMAIAMRGRTSFLTDVVPSFFATVHQIPYRIKGAWTGLAKVFGARDSARSLPAVVVPMALVGVFVTIFGFANPLVGRWLHGLGGLLGVPSAGHVFFWMVALFGAVLLVRPAVWRSKAPEKADATSSATPGVFFVARNALVPLNVVFFVYNALDAAYLWAGAPPPGVSERAYAHQGVAWLTLALLVLTVVVGVMFKGALAHDPRARTTRMLAFAWLAQGLVLALGTFRRLSIHVTTSGLSNLRFLGLTGIVLVVGGLVLVGAKLHARRSFAWLLRRQLDAFVVSLLAFSLLPTHLVSANVNVKRVMTHQYQALVHAEEQAAETESAAALLPILDHDDERIRRGMAALLLNERDALRKEAKLQTSWRDRDLSSSKTLRALEAATPKLEAVLGDVERSDAIVPFEYIRNSSIEGEIAQSEIDKVKLAPTRPQKAAELWAIGHDGASVLGAIAIEELPRREGVDRALASFEILRMDGKHEHVKLALERKVDATSKEWHVPEPR